MTYKYLPADLPERLRKAGLKVVEIDGWESRGRPPSTGEFLGVGVLNHHTGAHDAVGDFDNDLAYAKWMFLTGRSDLPAPLCQLSISQEGTVYVGAAGRANHAGTAKPSGSVAGGDGNALYTGIEWMTSGTQKISPAMMDAAVTTNAVLLEISGNSVQTVSCHYQTSVTGKWDIGDPDGIAFRGTKVLNVPKFRGLVQAALDAKKPAKPVETPVEVDEATWVVDHISMQFSDTDAQKWQDVKKIFAEAKENRVRWITGTEAGPGDDKVLANLLQEVGEEFGYNVFVSPTGDGWIAVKAGFLNGKITTGFVPVIPSSGKTGSSRKHGEKGVFWVSGKTDNHGRVTIGTSHYLTKGREPGGKSVHGKSDHYQWNRLLAEAIGDWAREHGKGADLVFYGGDQNIVDEHNDTFFGSPLTSVWDEIEKWQNTGHGNIDVIATFDRDKRVRAVKIRSFNDKQFFLHTDHYLVRAVLKVERL